MNVPVPVSLEVLVEEPSAETALRVLLPRIVPDVRFEIVTFTGKTNLLSKLPHRLRDYARYWSEINLRVAVLVDRDDDDCGQLKAVLRKMSDDAGLPAQAVLLRIAIEELEAWFFGDVRALHAAYPRVPIDLDKQVKYRDPEVISGGAWEALEHVLQKHGYHQKRLFKSKAASDIAPHMNVENNNSKSFQAFRDGLRRLVNEGTNA